MKRLLLALLLLLGVPALCFAAPATPEIDMSAAPAAVAFLSGALLVLRGWRKR